MLLIPYRTANLWRACRLVCPFLLIINSFKKITVDKARFTWQRKLIRPYSVVFVLNSLNKRMSSNHHTSRMVWHGEVAFFVPPPPPHPGALFLFVRVAVGSGKGKVRKGDWIKPRLWQQGQSCNTGKLCFKKCNVVLFRREVYAKEGCHCTTNQVNTGDVVCWHLHSVESEPKVII